MATLEETTRDSAPHDDGLRAHLVDEDMAVRELLFDRLPPGARVREVGAGRGRYTATLLDEGHRVTAVDLSRWCLDQIWEAAETAHRADRLRMIRGDFVQVARGLALGGQDAVVFIDVLHQFPDRRAIV